MTIIDACRYPFTVLLGGICLVLAMGPWAGRPVAAEDEYPTLNELMERGELEEVEAEDPTDAHPDPDEPDASYYANWGNDPAPLAPLSDEDQAPLEASDDDDAAMPAAPAAPKVALVPVPRVPMSQKVVTIGRVPFMDLKQMLDQYKGLIDFLKKELGAKDVRVVTAKDYSGVQNALARGTIDFAWLGPMAYVIGAEKLPMIPLAQAKRRTGAAYRGVFFTRKDSGILGIEEIKDRVIGFVDPESASGYLYPLYFLHRSNINPHTYCKKVEFLGKHDAILPAVLARKIDVGVCLEDTLVAVKDPKIREQVLILGKTYEVPSDVVACREDCDPALRDAFQKALMKTRTLKQTANPVTGLPPILEFLPVNGASLTSVRGVLNAIKHLRTF
jgi:phosphonate transport system substrate-binding protein